VTDNIEDLKRRVERLERLILPMDRIVPHPVVPTPSWARHCEECGIDLSNSAGYVCVNLRCPASGGVQ
jgi:hypothetical protein